MRANFEATQTPKSVNSLKTKKHKGLGWGKQLYGFWKKQIEVEENRLNELQILAEAIESEAIEKKNGNQMERKNETSLRKK